MLVLILVNQCVVHGSAALALPERILEMQNLRLHPRSTKYKPQF